MFDALELIEPYFVGFGLLGWETWVAWCLWNSIRSDAGLQRSRQVSNRDTDAVNRAAIREDRSLRSRTPYTPATSA
jgi:hypothetical protein